MIESIPAPVRMVALLTASNVFMTFAWYGHLKALEQRVWYVAALITLCVFVPFALVFMKQRLELDFLWAGLCLIGAVYFVSRSA